MDPATMMMLANTAGSLFGERKLGGIAPGFQPPQQTAPLGAKEATDALIRQQMSRMQQGPPVSPAQISQLAGIPQMGPPEAAPQMGPPEAQDDPATRFRSQGLLGKIGQFPGNVGRFMERPVNLLGIAGLSEIDPRLGMAGLLAGGIFGGRRGN